MERRTICAWQNPIKTKVLWQSSIDFICIGKLHNFRMSSWLLFRWLAHRQKITRTNNGVFVTCLAGRLWVFVRCEIGCYTLRRWLWFREGFRLERRLYTLWLLLLHPQESCYNCRLLIINITLKYFVAKNDLIDDLYEWTSMTSHNLPRVLGVFLRVHSLVHHRYCDNDGPTYVPILRLDTIVVQRESYEKTPYSP